MSGDETLSSVRLTGIDTAHFFGVDDMKVKVALPPNFEIVARHFPEAVRSGVMFCYGLTVYNPSGLYVTEELLAHEVVHARRQLTIGPDEWWAQYIASRAFRYDEEAAAHVAEYRAILDATRNKRTRREYLEAIAKRLSGPLYANGVTFQAAKTYILEHV